MKQASSREDIALENGSRYLQERVDLGVDRGSSLSDTGSTERSGAAHRLGNDTETGSSTLQVESPSETLRESKPIANNSNRAHLTSLPSELIDRILTFLEPVELVIISRTCRILFAHAHEDIDWRRYVQENVPGFTLSSPSPYSSFRELYIAHDPHWFLPKYKIWFCDYFIMGKIVIARYDPRRGCIEGYRLLAERDAPVIESWEADPEVLIHSFNPTLRLHMDDPVLHLIGSARSPSMIESGRFCAEIPMLDVERRHHGVYSNFLLTRPVRERPNMQLWPPPTIPSHHRVRNASQQGFIGDSHKPQRRSQISNLSFRIRHWMEMTGGPNTPGFHLGEEVYTYATLDPMLYTPTEDKPWRGIWVGDYSGHGCEFLLINQPDDMEPFDDASIIQREGETPEEFQTRKKEERLYRGSLEAIKLTGDPNVPRGEYTFIADDLSEAGYIRTASEARFRGARIVKSRGHTADPMFRDDKYIESQLIMISHNKLAQYWIEFGHISFYERVNIDSFLSPANDPVPGFQGPH